MAYPDLPNSAKQKLASQNMRWRHSYWHLVKNERFVTHPRNTELVNALSAIGWSASFTGQAGAGLDFLFMHRMMIKNLNQILAAIGDIKWPQVTGWSEIPSTGSNEDWPEPFIEKLGETDEWSEELQDSILGISQARSADIVAQNLSYAQIFRNPAFLTREDITLDQYGILIETTVHNWMHMRFAAAPPLDFEDISTENDWLGTPFSSHVNPYFWKLHGWIDDCIGYWEEANGVAADFSDAWRPPLEAPPWDELELLTSEAVVFAKSASKSPLFGNIRPFITPTHLLERSIAQMAQPE